MPLKTNWTRLLKWNDEQRSRASKYHRSHVIFEQSALSASYRSDVNLLLKWYKWYCVLSYQLLTATAHDDWTPPVLWLNEWLTATSQSQSYVTTDGQTVCLAWCQASIWGPRPDLYYCQKVTVVLMWGALPDKRMSLSFRNAAGLRQGSHFLVRVSRDSWPYFTASDSRFPQPGGPPGTQRPSYIPRHWVPFSSSPIKNYSQSYGGGIRTRLHAGKGRLL
jgi:hypothetical protein